MVVAFVPSFCLPESIYFIFSKDLRGASIIITYHCVFTNTIPDFESSHFKDDNFPCSSSSTLLSLRWKPPHPTGIWTP